MIEIIAQIETAYWDLVYAQRNLQVQLEGVRLANAQVSSNERQVEQGVLAPSDVVAAKVQVSTFEQNVYVAQQSVTNAENSLKNLMLADRNSPIWSNPIVPITPVTLDPPKLDLQSSLVTALANRPEITQLETNAEINKIDQRFFRDQTKPQIDFVGSYTSAGLAGTPLESSGTNPLTAGLTPLITRINQLSELNNLPPIMIDTGGGGSTIPGNLTGGYFQSVTNILAQRYPTYQVGLRISLPLKNTVAEANLGKSLVEENRIQSRRDKTELQVETEVRNALQAVRSQESRLNAATEARIAAEQLYESEQRKNLNGTSTVFLVLQRQTDLINARGREVQAQTDLNKAITQFQRSIGTTLDAAGVTFNERTPVYTRPKRTEITTVFGNNIKNMKDWIKDRETKLREFFELDSETEIVSPEAVESFEVSERIARHLEYFNIEWHIIPSEESVSVKNESYGKRLYPMIKREVNPNEYKKTSSYRAIISGHGRHQGKIVGIETTMKPKYLPQNHQQYSTPYGFEPGDPFAQYFGKAKFTEGTRYGHNYSRFEKFINIVNDDWKIARFNARRFSFNDLSAGDFQSDRHGFSSRMESKPNRSNSVFTAMKIITRIATSSVQTRRTIFRISKKLTRLRIGHI